MTPIFVSFFLFLVSLFSFLLNNLLNPQRHSLITEICDCTFNKTIFCHKCLQYTEIIQFKPFSSIWKSFFPFVKQQISHIYVIDNLVALSVLSNYHREKIRYHIFNCYRCVNGINIPSIERHNRRWVPGIIIITIILIDI